MKTYVVILKSGRRIKIAANHVTWWLDKVCFYSDEAAESPHPAVFFQSEVVGWYEQQKAEEIPAQIEDN